MQFVRGKRCGLGRAILLGDEEQAFVKRQRNKDSLYKPVQYEGQFDNDKRHGKGVLTLMNRDKLYGSFHQGYVDGFVKYVAASGEVKYAQYKRGQRETWLTGRQLQAALGQEAAKFTAAGVFAGTATGVDVRRARRAAEGEVEVEQHSSKPFNIVNIHAEGNKNDDLLALEARRAARRKRQAATD